RGCGTIRAHRAGECVAIGDGERFEAEQLRSGDQLFWMRAAAQEREIGGDIELGVRWRCRGHLPVDPVQIPGGRANLALLIEAVAEDPIAMPVLVLDAVIVARPRALLFLAGG